MRPVALSAALGLLVVVIAAAAAPAAETPHTQHIREAHFKRLQERLDKPVAVLREQCRFESDIATLPPKAKVAITFDDGPDPVHTPRILELLAKHRVQAAFFMIGEKAKEHAELVRAVEAAGHLLGNHSWSHPNFHALPAEAQLQEIERSDALYTAELQSGLYGDQGDVAQGAPPRLWRYPYGNANCEANARLRERGYRLVGWHVDSCDWAFDSGGRVDAKEAASCEVLLPFRADFVGHVLAQARARHGGIVLMHETHRITVDHLDELLTRLAAEGFVVAPLLPAFDASMR